MQTFFKSFQPYRSKLIVTIKKRKIKAEEILIIRNIFVNIVREN